MDPIRNASQLSLPPVTSGGRRGIESAPPLPKPAVSSLPDAGADEVLAGAEQRRHEAVLRVAQAIANSFVLGSQRFTIFKDSTGQYITRFTDMRDGRVTYIPEPELFKMGSGAPIAPTVTLSA